MHEQYIVTKTGHKTSVILPVEEYETILEDLHDLRVLAERKNEPKVSLDDVKKRLSQDGLL